jgi:hypothetical protein
LTASTYANSITLIAPGLIYMAFLFFIIYPGILNNAKFEVEKYCYKKYLKTINGPLTKSSIWLLKEDILANLARQMEW